jgi:hypothetical protein
MDRKGTFDLQSLRTSLFKYVEVLIIFEPSCQSYNPLLRLLESWRNGLA